MRNRFSGWRRYRRLLSAQHAGNPQPGIGRGNRRGPLFDPVVAFVKTKATTWDSDISDLLGWSLRHADYPDRVVTLGMVASHSAGLSDDAGYLIPPDQTVQDWCRSQPVFAAEPGTRFSVFKLSIF